MINLIMNDWVRVYSMLQLYLYRRFVCVCVGLLELSSRIKHFPQRLARSVICTVSVS